MGHLGITNKQLKNEQPKGNYQNAQIKLQVEIQTKNPNNANTYQKLKEMEMVILGAVFGDDDG